MSLIHWWPFINHANDIADIANFSGASVISTGGKIGNCTKQWGTKITVNNTKLQGLYNFSVAMWVRLDSAASSSAWSDLFGMQMKKGSTETPLRAEVGTTGGNSLMFYCNAIAGTDGGAAGFSLTKDVWTHLVFTKQGSVLTTYINGSQVSTTTWANMAEAYCMGEFHLSDGGFYASFNDVRLYSHVLTIKEIKELAKGLVLHYPCNSDYALPSKEGKMYNAAGFDYTLSCIGTPTFVDDSACRDKSIDFNGAGYYKTDSFGLSAKAITVAFWVKIPPTTTSQHFLFGTFNNWTGNGIGMWRDSQAGYSILIKSDSVAYTTCSIALSTNTWTHIAIVYNGTEWTVYMDGLGITGSTYGSGGTISNPVMYLGNSLFNGAPTSEIDEAQLSDFRIYATALSTADIKELCYNKWAVNREGQVFTNILNESTDEKSQKQRTGIQKANYLSEVIELNDGSYWLQVQHHDNMQDTNLFSSTDAFADSFVYHNDKCWCDFPLIEEYGLYNSKYEFLVLDQPGTRSDPIVVRRWSQTVNPSSATWSDIKAGSSKFTAIQNIPSMNGGMYRDFSSTYMRIANANESNWYGAFGCYSTWTYGVPTFGNTGNYGILDLYVRVSPENAKKYREFKKGIVMPTTFNEI